MTIGLPCPRNPMRVCMRVGELDEGQAGASKVPREIKRANVTLTNNIGAGAFGEVVLACAPAEPGAAAWCPVPPCTIRGCTGQWTVRLFTLPTAPCRYHGHRSGKPFWTNLHPVACQDIRSL